MSDQAEPIGAEGVVDALANQLLHAEGEQAVRDMARHVGDEVHGVLKRHGMLMKTTAGAIGVGVLAAVNVLADTLEFARRSMDEEQERAEISAAIRKLFVDLAPSELGLAATPDPKAAGVEREAIAKLLDLIETAGEHGDEMAIVQQASVVRSALRAVDAAPGGGADEVLAYRQTIRDVVFAFQCTRWDPGAKHDLSEEIIAAMLDAAPATPTAAPAPNVQALVEALNDLVSWFDRGPSQYGPWIIKAGPFGADDAVQHAKATLAAIQAPAGERVA